MPFPVAAAITAGAALAGQGIQMGATKMNNTKNYNRQRSLMDKQFEQNQAMALFNNEQQMKMWEATGPQGQMEQLKKAGLNPGLIYGMGNAGGQTAQAAQGGPVSGGSYHGDNPGAGAGIMGLQLSSQLQLLQAQKENIEADTANKLAEVPVKGAQVPNINASTAALTQGVENSKAQQELTKVQTDIEKLRLESNTATFNDQIEIVMRQRQSAVENLKMLRRENAINQETMQTKIATIKAEYAAVLIQNALNAQKTAESASNVQVNMADIKKKFVDMAQGWQNLENQGKQVNENQRSGSYQRFINDIQASTKLSADILKQVISAAGFMMSGPKSVQYHETVNYGE